jgi:hypothetical protein
MSKKVLFILKQRHEYGPYENGEIPCGDKTSSSGLGNSTRFVVDMLKYNGIDADVEVAVDNNDIDRLVTFHKPAYVIIEALWVVPEKFDVLIPLHPSVTWIVRLHSNAPFLAQEGTAFGWIRGYLQRGVKVAANHRRLFKELLHVNPEAFEHDVWLLPNYYPVKHEQPLFSRKVCDFKRDKERVLNIGCFGAIRPMKNQVIQAIAAIKYANKRNRVLRFHINASRIEQKGEPVLKNLQSLFKGSKHELVEHPWLRHLEFRALIAEMDALMQVSFSETFNIVAADAVSQGVPVVTSDSIDWISPSFHTDPCDSNAIQKGLERCLKWSNGPWRNIRGLRQYDKESQKLWLHYFGEVH